MKRRIFGWITTFLGIVLAVGALEVLAVAWITIEDGRYTPAAELFDRTQNTYVRDMTRGSACRYVDTLYPHPYVGFVHHANPPCGPINTNNVGLINEDFPTIKRADRFTILLAGGSVASQLAQIGLPPAPRFLEEELNRNYVSPNGKPFLVLNGGDGAWKEPQPFILFALHAGAVDGVVTLGGPNEFYMFRPYEKQRLEWPISNFVEVNPFVADENFGDAAIGWVLGRIAGALSHDPLLGRSHAVYLLVRSVEAIAKGRGVWTANKRTTLASLFALPDEVRGDSERLFALQLELYRKYQRAIEAVARDNGVRAAYFLQPVPAYGKTLTPEELAVVGDISYGGLYRRMVEGMMVQRDRGMAVFDLGDLLAEVKETVYADQAHFRQARDGESPGYRLMARRMAAHLAEAWRLEARQQEREAMRSGSGK